MASYGNGKWEITRFPEHVGAKKNDQWQMNYEKCKLECEGVDIVYLPLRKNCYAQALKTRELDYGEI